MPDIIALEDVKSTRTEREVKGGTTWVTRFLQPPKGTRLPQFFMVENTPRRFLRTHYHDVDQFQIIVDGGGTLGKHAVSPFTVHFARAHTPYGPILAGDQGLTWLTIRARRDAEGAQFLPEKREQLEQVLERNPWQYSEDPVFEASDEAVAVRSCSVIKDDRGLAVYSIRMQPNTRTVVPGPAGTGGQYVVALRGSLVDRDGERKALATCFLEAHDSPLELAAGATGLEAIVLNFPRLEAPAARPARSDTAAFKTWRCVLCAFVYDEAAGMPDEGVPPGTRWQDVPESWSCPDCAAGKLDFEMVEV